MDSASITRRYVKPDITVEVTVTGIIEPDWTVRGASDLDRIMGSFNAQNWWGIEPNEVRKAKWIWDAIINHGGPVVRRVRVFMSQDSWADYDG